MQGRNEHKKLLEDKIKDKLNDCPKCVGNFYYHMTTENNSHTTKKTYINHIIGFLNFYKDILKLSSIKELTSENINLIDSNHIDLFMDSLTWQKNNSDKPTSAAYRATTISALTTFFTYLKEKNYIPTNPLKDKIKRPKVPSDNKVIYLTESEIQTVLDDIDKGVGTDRAKDRQKDWKYRDLLLVLIPIYTGLRVTALDEINVDNINFEELYIMATDKRNKTREHYFDDKIEKLLKTWLIDRERILGEVDCNALFISNRKTRMHQNSIVKIVKKYTCNIKKKITPHKLRATCATNLYRLTKDIYLVADTLGHEDTTATKKYTEIGKERQKSVPNTMGSMIKIRT